ncbi:methyl-accepting chemotaxis protein [Colwellia sp. 75C3]|uniref:methyl-accepting chemotaxis protein n=1 Tax=Colwellia sp. 75C3 TaxID=888425 RepID=UPI000C34770D|nr:methyl-accepting chemotaxis protein [Colwellia sp. 75C3]PKG82061.1 methyl-accepting chemotaxis protein [Colwellia sp. 75C3]
MKVTKSISFKLILSALLIVTILVSTFGIYSYISQSNHLKLKQENHLLLVESRLKLNLPASIWNYEEEQIKGILNSEQQSDDISLITLVNESGEVTAKSKGKIESEFKSFKLHFVEDGKPNELGTVHLYISNAPIESELSALAITAIVKGVLLAVFLVLFLFIIFSKLVTSPLSEVADALENIARGEGDLTQRIRVKRDDEIGKVSDSFNHFAEKIQSLVQSIQTSVQHTSNVSSQVCSASEASKGHLQNQQLETDQVAAAITQMSSSAKEIAGNVQSTASAADMASNNAKEVSSIIVDSIDSIKELSLHLDEATSVVGSLEKDVDGIVSVLDVIRGIADQTNLLALNAAIEAARAGEQGRGFAVVADEVRALASRTQESTSEIQKTIEKLQLGAKSAVKVMEKSQLKSQESVKGAESSGESINSILTSTVEINDMASHIESAVNEQSTVAEELNENINRIVSSGHSSLEQLEEMTQHSRSLQDNADELSALAQQFKA